MNANPIKYTDPTGQVAAVDDAIIIGGTILVGTCIATNCTKPIADAIGNTIDAIGEMCKGNDCPPCEPYGVGTVGYQGPKLSVRGKDGTRAGTGALHYIIFEVQQNPKDCKCRWQETKKLYGHHYYGTPEPTWVNLNGKGRPPSYP